MCVLLGVCMCMRVCEMCVSVFVSLRVCVCSCAFACVVCVPLGQRSYTVSQHYSSQQAQGALKATNKSKEQALQQLFRRSSSAETVE
jgi:hypothetical protein